MYLQMIRNKKGAANTYSTLINQLTILNVQIIFKGYVVTLFFAAAAQKEAYSKGSITGIIA
jgi:hypothetical protein